MRKTGFTLLVIITLLLNIGCGGSAQVTEQRRMLEQIWKAERESRLLTDNERKLEGGLFGLLRLAEEAETSETKRARLERSIRAYADIYEPDSKFRIRVCLSLSASSREKEVIEAVKSLDGEIIYVGRSEFIYVRINPLKFRNLIHVNGIVSITTIERLKTNSVAPMPPIESPGRQQ